MRCEITLHEDTTTLFLRWEITPEGKEAQMLIDLGGPVVLVVPARHYVDVAGTYHEALDVEVPIHPHAGRRNFGQAKFTEHEARRSFTERLVDGVIVGVADFVHEAAPGSLDVEGHRVQAAPARTSAS